MALGFRGLPGERTRSYSKGPRSHLWAKLGVTGGAAGAVFRCSWSQRGEALPGPLEEARFVKLTFGCSQTSSGGREPLKTFLSTYASYQQDPGCSKCRFRTPQVSKSEHT